MRHRVSISKRDTSSDSAFIRVGLEVDDTRYILLYPYKSRVGPVRYGCYLLQGVIISIIPRQISITLPETYRQRGL